ncbi:MAG: response regulator transcription factor [Clostridia bacterium]|nr:response regulator transcription factor [Clostridia bacterium]
MLNITILEDQAEQTEHLKKLLGRYGDTHPGFACTLHTYDNPILFLDEYRCDMDILFLDIQMPDILGIDVAKKIRKKDERVMIIFITMLTQYAIEGYSVGAFDYVLKPVRYEEFSAKMDRACRMLSHRSSEKTLEIRTKESTRRISVDRVTYLEVVNHDVIIHTDTANYRQWGSLKLYEDQLQEEHFARCNVSYLINLKYVQGVTGTMVQVAGEDVPISKAKRKDFLAALAQYKGGSR